LPFNPAQNSRGITVLSVSLRDFTVSPSPPWTAGQTISLRVQSVQDGTPRAGVKIRFYINKIDERGGVEASTYVEATTGSDGYASAS